MEGDGGDLEFFEAMSSHRVRGFMRLMRRLPSEPRCSLCRAPYGGLGGKIMRPLGFGPSRKNPRLCHRCFDEAPEGGIDMEVGVLFADVRGFTELSESRPPGEVAALLNRFYDAAVKVLCRHAIIDKLVGDQVMALYLPRLFDGEVGEHMVNDARELMAAADPWIQIGIGLDYGVACVGNVGSGEVKDFTAIGDVVNTAARLQGVAGTGEIVVSRRVAGQALAGAEERTYELKGKSEPERALVITPTRSSQAAWT